MLSKIITKASFLVTPDDPKPETSASTASSSRAQAAEDTSKRLDQVREICPDLVEEIKEEWDKKEVCKMCGDKVNFYLLSKVQNTLVPYKQKYTFNSANTKKLIMALSFPCSSKWNLKEYV